MGKFIVVDSDSKVLTLIREALASNDKHEFLFYETLNKAIEVLNIEPLGLLVIESSLFEPDPEKKLQEILKIVTHPENKNIKIAILSYNDSHTYLKKFLVKGIYDFIIKPIDKPLFLQKVDLLLSKSPTVEKQVYSITTSAGVDVAFSSTIEEISEFGLTLRTNRTIGVNDFLTFYSDIFLSEGRNYVVGRCYHSQRHPKQVNDSQVFFAFIGITPPTLKQIRSWLRKEYIRKKGME